MRVIEIWPIINGYKILECNPKCGPLSRLVFQYSIYHENKFSNCECGDKTLIGICIKKLAQRSCFANSTMKTDCSFIVNDNDNVIDNDNDNDKDLRSSFANNVNDNDNAKDNFNDNDIDNDNVDDLRSSFANNINDLRISFSNNVNQNPNPNPNPNVNVSVNPRKNKVLTRNCNKCNSIKPLTVFDESKYTCRNRTSAKVNCLYCPSIVRYDGIRAHVKREHPDVELTRGFSRNLTERSADPRSTKLPLRGSVELVPRSVITYTGDTCSCNFFYFVSFL